MNYDGSYSNEFEAAYDLSRMEYDPADELDLIMGHVEAGKYVVVIKLEVCCKFTDALLAVEHRIAGVHDTKEAAHAEADELGGYVDGYVVGPDDRRPEERAADARLDVPEDDIPF
jgi:hypothetical protein